jgi:hypothetical protein
MVGAVQEVAAGVSSAAAVISSGGALPDMEFPLDPLSR